MSFLKMQCHCYVCECRAPCPLWNSDSVISNDRHCHATYKEERWKTFKKQLLNKRNPINVQRPSASLRTGRQDLTELDKLGQLLDSLSQSLTSLEQLLKKKKGQIFKGWRLKLLLRLMKAEVQVSLYYNWHHITIKQFIQSMLWLVLSGLYQLS